MKNLRTWMILAIRLSFNPTGVAVWEGGSGERAGLKAISGDDWIKLDVEAATAVKA